MAGLVYCICTNLRAVVKFRFDFWCFYFRYSGGNHFDSDYHFSRYVQELIICRTKSVFMFFAGFVFFFSFILLVGMSIAMAEEVSSESRYFFGVPVSSSSASSEPVSLCLV